MANEQRVRGNLCSGTLSVALLAGDTTMSSAGLANLPAVTSAGHAVIVLENEIVYVTAHTASATTATILRAQEGTSAAAHALNVAWVHGAVVSDFDSVLGYAQAVVTQGSITAEVALTSLSVTVTVPYAGHRVKITGTGRFENTGTNISSVRIKEGATQLNAADLRHSAATTQENIMVMAVVVPTAGSHTYNLAAAASAGTSTLDAAATQPAFILVEDLGPAL